MRKLLFAIAIFTTGLGVVAQEPDAALFQEIVKAQKEQALTLTVEELKTYEGAFELEEGFILRFFVKGDILMSQATGQSSHPLLAQGNHKFMPTTFPATMTFIEDDKGGFSSIILVQSGKEYTAKRIE